MSAGLLPIPRPVYWMGNPVSGALINVYLAGQSLTPIVTYPTAADAAAGTNPNTNPVLTNSQGYLSTEIWVPANQLCRVIITTADQLSTIWDQDSLIAITAADTSITASLNDPNGNPYLTVSYVTSAVNCFNFTNSASGAPPVMTAVGSDTNVDGYIISQGAGSGVAVGATSGPGLLGVLTNGVGSNSINLTVPASLAASQNFTLPADDTDTNNSFFISDGQYNAVWATPTAANAALFSTSLKLLIKTTQFTTTGTWNPVVNLVFADIIVIGGGGGGGNASAGSQLVQAGSGGGAGGISYLLGVSAATLGNSQTVTVGTGGAAAASGTSSSFGALAAATGGTHGTSTSTISAIFFQVTNGGIGGLGSGGTINLRGGTGGMAQSTNLIPTGFVTAFMALPGEGADSLFGSGGRTISGNSGGSGGAGTGYGAGGGGTISFNSNGSGTAGAGAPGIVIVREYYYG